MTPATEHELNQLGLRDLQRRFHEVVGEETRCPNRIFLIRRILSATAPGASSHATETTPTEESSTEMMTLEPATTANADLVAEAMPSQEQALDGPPAQETDALNAPMAAEPQHASEMTVPANEEALSTTSAEPTASEGATHEATDREAEEVADEEDASAIVLEPAPNTEATPPVLALAEDESSGDDKASLVAAEDSVVTRDALASTAPPAHRAPSTSRETQPRSPRGRFRDMTVAQLQSLYLATVGRSTGSTDRRYLEWKIREAEKGRIPVGPREARAPEVTDADTARVLPLRLESEAVEAMDATWKSHGMKSRMEFFRRALGHYLAHLGAHGAAMHFTSQTPPA